VYKETKSQSDTLELQKDLIALEEWEKTWVMSFHPDKCNIMLVTRSKIPILFNYHLKGHQIVAADTTKYLGVDLSHDLSWSHHIDRTTKKANSMLEFLNS
jgi:myo-inositol-hexaphosphate 3-phosphohydrolase